MHKITWSSLKGLHCTFRYIKIWKSVFPTIQVPRRHRENRWQIVFTVRKFCALYIEYLFLKLKCISIKNNCFFFIRWACGIEEGAFREWEGGFPHHSCTWDQDSTTTEPPQYSKLEGNCHGQTRCCRLQKRQR